MDRTTSIVMAAALTLGSVSVNAATNPLLARIHRDGKLQARGPAYLSLAQTRFGKAPKRVPANAIARNSSPGNSLDQVGDGPAGFGKTFTWDRKDDELLLVAFLNAADDLGISVDGLKVNDLIAIQSAAGIASFSQDKGNPTASSIVGLLATGAQAAAGITGNPELVPVINAAESFAKDQFKATNAKTKRRDAYGEDPGSGHKAREEGGVLVCLPGSGGPYYSGDDDAKARWIKPDGTRDEAHLPAHIPATYGYFLNRQSVVRAAQADGQMYLVPWDWKFEDNAGYYKVFIHLKKWKGDPDVVLK